MLLNKVLPWSYLDSWSSTDESVGVTLHSDKRGSVPQLILSPSDFNYKLFQTQKRSQLRQLKALVQERDLSAVSLVGKSADKVSVHFLNILVHVLQCRPSNYSRVSFTLQNVLVLVSSKNSTQFQECLTSLLTLSCLNRIELKSCLVAFKKDFSLANSRNDTSRTSLDEVSLLSSDKSVTPFISKALLKTSSPLTLQSLSTTLGLYKTVSLCSNLVLQQASIVLTATSNNIELFLYCICIKRSRIRHITVEVKDQTESSIESTSKSLLLILLSLEEAENAKSLSITLNGCSRLVFPTSTASCLANFIECNSESLERFSFDEVNLKAIEPSEKKYLEKMQRLKKLVHEKEITNRMIFKN